jgi:hypothetical protein
MEISSISSDTNTTSQGFIAWLGEHLRSNQSNRWRQIGLWSFTLSVAVFIVPRVV